MEFLKEIEKVSQEAECIFSEDQVNKALDRIANEISLKLKDSNPLVICVLNGGILATARLVLRLSFPLEMDSIKAGRYQGETRGTELRWHYKPAIPLKGRTVLLVDDVLDEGITLAELKKWCFTEEARDVYTAVLVEKELGHEKPCKADFVGLVADNRYLFGYGMDYKGHLRHWPGIFACHTVY